MMVCLCGSGAEYEMCCARFHWGNALPETAEQLMRSRYVAYVLGNIDYIVATTVPAQQDLLDKVSMTAWAQQTQWLGLTVHHAAKIGARHAQVAFSADFMANGVRGRHDELSGFVWIDGRWFFVDPTVRLPNGKERCVCGSGKRFKGCCGRVLGR